MPLGQEMDRASSTALQAYRGVVLASQATE